MRASDWSSDASRYLREPQSPYGPRPHVVAGLRRDHQLVAVRGKVVGQHPPEVDLGRAVRRPVVVGQIEVGDAEIERATHDRPLRVVGPVVAEVVPQPERHGGQLEPAAPATAVLHRVVSVVCCVVCRRVHGGEHTEARQRRSSRNPNRARTSATRSGSIVASSVVSSPAAVVSNSPSGSTTRLSPA